MRQRPVVIERLSQLGRGQTVTVYCGNPHCPRHTAGRDLDVGATIARHGDLPLRGLGARFRCAACGYRPAETRLGWDLPPAAGAGWV